MKRNIATSEGVKEVEQIGNIHTILGYDFFKYSINEEYNRITHLETGMALLMGGEGTFTEAERFLSQFSEDQLNDYFEKGKNTLKRHGIEYPVN